MDIIEKMARAHRDSTSQVKFDDLVPFDRVQDIRAMERTLAVLPDHIRKQIEGEWGKLPATCPACKEPLICRECDINLTIEALDMVQIEGAE